MKKILDITIIGYLLAILYAFSMVGFIFYSQVPDLQIKSSVYLLLFGISLIGSVAVARLKEWGRKVIVVSSAMTFFMLLGFYVKTVDLFPLCYFIMNIVIFLYFNQSKIKLQFMGRRVEDWHSVLIIDDDLMLVKLIRPILMAHGFSVLTATSGEEGIQVAQLQKPDIILLDVILPGIKGREVCRKLKEDPEVKKIPVIFLTAKDSRDDIQAEKEVGGETHLTKPVNGKVLISTIRNILAKKA